MRNTRYLILILLLVLNTRCILAQNNRPKVGLVLSGGGAKGLAHIGILRAIDSAGLKIDYITGTSMGSIIASMYAIGYTGKQIDSIAKTLNWDILLSNKPVYSDVSLDEKDEYARYAVEVGIKDLKPQIGTGLIESEELWLKFAEIYFPVYDIKDFNQFNIPFKCIATDLGTGKAIVHDKGEIIKALRSSMAIPSVFTAIELDELKLVDGGIVRNFPVTDVKGMGADFVIGVNLFSGLTKTTDLNTALDIMYQITQYKDAEDLVKEKKLCNVIIEPNVSGFSAGSFSATDSITRIGNEMGKLYYPYFKNLADSLNKLFPIDFDPNNRLPRKDSVTIDSYTIKGLDKTSRSLLINKLNLREGKTYHVHQLNQSFRNAYSTRYYDKIFYTLTPTQNNGKAKLNCELAESPLTALKVGLSYHSYTGAAIIANITQRNLLFDKSRTMLKLSLGENPRVLLQHKQAMGKNLNKYFTISYQFEGLPFPIYDTKNLSNQKYLYKLHLQTIDLNYKRLLGRNAGIGFGLSRLNYKFSPDIAANGSFNGKIGNYYGYLNVEINTLNRRFFPTQGFDVYAELGILFGRKANLMINSADSSLDASSLVPVNESERLKIHAIKYTSLNNKLTLIKSFSLGMQRDYSNFIFDNFFLGGVQQIFRSQYAFAGLMEAQINTSSFAGVQLGVQYRVISELYLIGRINGGYYGFSTSSRVLDVKAPGLKGILGAGLSLGYNLSAMPMEFTIMYSPEVAKVYGHVRIGFLF